MKYKFLIISLSIAAALPAAANMNLANTKWAVSVSGCKSGQLLGRDTVLTEPINIPPGRDVITSGDVLHFIDSVSYRWLSDGTTGAPVGVHAYNMTSWTQEFPEPGRTIPQGINQGIALKYGAFFRDDRAQTYQVLWISGRDLILMPIVLNLQKICGTDPNQVFVHIFSKVSG